MSQDECEFKRQRMQFVDTVAENDYRIWYITRLHPGPEAFPDDKLRILANYKDKARDDEGFVPSGAELAEFHGATMAAARFIGGRRPETIKQYARLQSGKIGSPLNGRLAWVAIVLVLALMAHGYNHALSTQITAMQAVKSSYLADEAGLLGSAGNLGETLARMCQHERAWGDAIRQLGRLQIPLPQAQATDSSARSICAVLRDEVSAGLPKAPVRDATVEDDKRAEAAFVAANAAFDERLTSLRSTALTHRPFDDGSTVALVIAKARVDLLSLLVVPALFALLGSLTSALRTADERIKALTFTPVDHAGLIARTMLGLVGGASVGVLLAEPGQTAAGAGLTLIGLSFAVGYAVEIFFNLFEGLKLSLGVKPNAPGAKDQEKAGG